jgi:dihydroorotate dehydrogenase
MSGLHTRLLFRLKPERAHHLAVAAMAAAGATGPGRALVRRLFGMPEARPVTLWGLRFRNPLGLAAGWDKDARALPGLGAMGFGHVEVGTVTPRPQPGNPTPRVFRLVADAALINRMGFPGRGAEVMAARLARWRRGPGKAEDRPVLGVNLGRNKDTPNERAAEDYATLVTRLGPLADYLVVNVSSPNTVGLRDLQARDALEALLRPVIAARDTVAREALTDGRKLPLLVKISPDLGPDALAATLEACLATRVDGLIATNTTLARPDLQDPARGETGGLSGAPLTARADAVLADAVRLLDGRLPVIAAGGVMTPADARRKLDLGAALVQVWTGFIYGGPSFPRAAVAALADG